jgi:hypothetical protein
MLEVLVSKPQLEDRGSTASGSVGEEQKAASRK